MAECLLSDVRALKEAREASASAGDIGKDSIVSTVVEEAESAPSAAGRRALPRKILSGSYKLATQLLSYAFLPSPTQSKAEGDQGGIESYSGRSYAPISAGT